MADAEEVVRRDRADQRPEVVASVIARRLEAIVERAPGPERATARAVVDEVVALLTVDGVRGDGALPGWSLVELSAEDGAPSGRRITLRR